MSNQTAPHFGYCWMMVDDFALQPDYSLRTFTGHSTTVMSLDFHPSKEDLLCSCDNNSEIRYWSINNGSCAGVFKVCNLMLIILKGCYILNSIFNCYLLLHRFFLNLLSVSEWCNPDEISTSSWKDSCCSHRELYLYT